MNTYKVIVNEYLNKTVDVRANTAKDALITQYILQGNGKEFINNPIRRAYVNANIKEVGEYFIAFHMKVLKD